MLQKIREKLYKKRRTIFGIIIFVISLLGIKNILLYTLEPTSPKNCDYKYPSGDKQVESTTILAESASELIELYQKGGFTNDASCMNKTSVYGVVAVHNIDDVRKTLEFAVKNGIKITPAGQQHSMGGQSFVKNGIVLDMKNYNEMSVNEETKVLTVQTGATWEQVQNFLDIRGLAVNAMQSINIFTVGGTLSVNAHGLGHKPGPIVETVRSIKIMNSDGKIIEASPTKNSELFSNAIGGYGLFGVILSTDISVVENEMYEWNTEYMQYDKYSDYYKKNISNDDSIRLTFARLSIAPQSYLKEIAVHTYTTTEFNEPLPSLESWGNTWANRLVINFSKTGGIGRWTRWTLEKYVEPMLHTCYTRNQAMSKKDACIVSRNQEMFDSMGYLKNKLKDTDILQEYFIPRAKMTEFVDGLRSIVKNNNANLLNVTIRIVHKDTITSLPYAKDDMFAFVLYFNQKFNDKETEILKKTTLDLIDLSADLDGTYYLPYQLYYSHEQLKKSYPEIDIFFETKRKYDKNELFVNTFYNKYGTKE